jgi:hypothetical protein
VYDEVGDDTTHGLHMRQEGLFQFMNVLEYTPVLEGQLGGRLKIRVLERLHLGTERTEGLDA